MSSSARHDLKFKYLLPTNWRDSINRYLSDDIPKFDYGGFVVGEKMEHAYLLGKSPGVIAGVPFFDGND